MTTRQVDWSGSTTSCRVNLDEYWQKTLDFLKIAARVLARDPGRARQDRSGGAARPADRGRAQAARSASRPGDRRRLDRLDAGDREAARDHREACRTAPWCCPVSTPISTMNRGTLIGGHDDGAPPASGHPQLAMHALLRRIGIVRDDVTALGASSARARLVSEAMRPSDATERWAQRIDERRATRRWRTSP